MELANEMFGLGVLQGYDDRQKERKAEREHDEDRAWQGEQRDRTRTQWSQQDKAAGLANDTAQMNNSALRDKMEREGAYEFLQDMQAGVNPTMAAARYNQRGVHKIDPASVKYDRGSGDLTFSSVDDIDGDGKPDVTQGKLPDLMSGAESILGKTKDRYMNTPDGSSVFDKQTGGFVANNAKDQQQRANTMKAVKDNEALIDIDPKTGRARVAYSGPQYGKGDAGGGRKISPFNPEGYAKDAQGEFARLVGGKYDPTTMQFDYGGASVKMVPFAQSMMEDVGHLNATAPGKVPPQFIASAYADAANQFNEDSIRANIAQGADGMVGKSERDDPGVKGLWGGLGKPKDSVVKGLQDKAVEDARRQLIAKARTAISYEAQRSQQDPSAGSTDINVDGPPGVAPAAAAPPAAAPVQAQAPAPAPAKGGATPPMAAFGRGLPGTWVKFKSGEIWHIDASGKPARGMPPRGKQSAPAQ